MASEEAINKAVAAGTEEAAAETAPMMGGKRSKWLAHVKKTMKAHKGKSLKQVLKMAKKTYKGGSAPSYLSPSPAAGPGSLTGGRRRRSTRRRTSRKH